MAARSRASNGRAPARTRARRAAAHDATPPPRTPNLDPAPMRRALHAWYGQAKRDLPWRRTRDPYAIWVSEIMLQQTRVEVVAPYYERFLQRFPDVAALARAPIEDVLHAWSGLGYYRRARHLHAAAQQVVADHEGCVPAAPGALEALPGIGRYTAGAIRSIAFGEPAPILDGNVTRVFARVYGLDAPVESAAMRASLWKLAAAWVDGDTPSETNQGLMELGATVCTAVAPACERCPLAGACDAYHTGRVTTLPRPKVRPPARRVAMIAAIVRRRGRVLLVQRQSGALLEAFWELPTCAGPAASLGPRLIARIGVAIGPARAVGVVRHRILSNAIHLEVLSAYGHTAHAGRRDTRTKRVRARVAPHRTQARIRARATPLANLELRDLAARWVRPEELVQLPIATLSRKALRWLSASRAAHRLDHARASQHDGSSLRAH